MITEVLPRLSTFSRAAPIPGDHGFEQIIAVNADQAIPIFALASPPPKWGHLRIAARAFLGSLAVMRNAGILWDYQLRRERKAAKVGSLAPFGSLAFP